MNIEEIVSARKRKVVVSVYLPMSLVDVVDRIAESEATTPPTIFERLLRKGMAVEREERRVAQGA